VGDSAVLEAVATSGLEERELALVLEAVQIAYRNTVGLDVPCDSSNTVTCCFESDSTDTDTDEDESSSSPNTNTNTNIITGALGRVLLLRTNIDEDCIEMIQYAIAEQMDQLLYSTNGHTPLLRQPVLISVVQANAKDDVLASSSTTLLEETKDLLHDRLASIIQHEVEQYEMAKPLPTSKKNKKKEDANYIPSLHVEIDGAMVTTDDFYSTPPYWDTSSVLVFDELVNDDLRKRLLDVTLGRDASQRDEWDDTTHGPNPSRWVRGGLYDIPDENNDGDCGDDDDDATSCWGLPAEAIEEICFQPHAAIEEFEGILSDLFPQFIVSRLPEAVFGDTVSPLNANAPTAGDQFDYHIDGDPQLAPPSPWTDVYGRYPNRIRGKPRFMSCLVYLNDEWDAAQWGAPTRFLDLPTDDYYDVLPRPGRCVIMDQDCSHTVVAPNAGTTRPRYSLVWKLILHPKTHDQDMTDLAETKVWPGPVLFGSAKQQPQQQQQQKQ
jgi:hypothetical protein